MFGALIITLVLILLVILYHVSTRKFDCWKKKNIPYIKPVPIFGNFGEYILLKKFNGEVAQSICQKFPKAPYVGAFYGTEPVLIVQDPEVIKLVTTTDYYYFSSREISNYIDEEVFTQNLFFTSGDRWRVMRQNLTPLFSSSKIKNMFYLIEQYTHVFEAMLDTEVAKNNVFLTKDILERFTLDCIGACAFGINMNGMEKSWQQNTFRYMGHQLMLPAKYRGFLLIARSMWPRIFYALGLKCFPTEVDRFFNKIMVEVFTERNYKPSSKNDFVDLILGMKEKQNYIVGDSIKNYKGDNKKITMKVDDEFLTAQCLLFFAAGFETSSIEFEFTLFELAKNKEAQERAHREVDDYLKRHNNKLGYECVSELIYLDACLSEALRLYPVLGILTREVVEDYRLPGGAVLEKGMRVHLPVYHIHRHPDFFSDPDEFRPERFLGEEKLKIKPHTYMGFGDGPRICIGMRFAKMQILAGMVTILKKYRVELADDTSRTPELGAITLIIRAKKNIKLKLIEREGGEQRMFAKD